MDTYDYLKHMTVLLTSVSDSAAQATGTGFFVKLNINKKDVSLIVTAKHVAEEMNKAEMVLHYRDGEKINGVAIAVVPEWVMSDDWDLACCKIDTIEEKFKKITGHKIYYTAIPEDAIVKESELKNINVLKEIIMPGYPSGLGSTHCNYPLLRKGYLASSPADNYENDIGYADIPSISGSSGSPILINNSVLKLIGVQSKALMENILSSADIGMYVDAYHILDLKDKVKDEKKDKEDKD